MSLYIAGWICYILIPSSWLRRLLVVTLSCKDCLLNPHFLRCPCSNVEESKQPPAMVMGREATWLGIYSPTSAKLVSDDWSPFAARNMAMSHPPMCVAVEDEVIVHCYLRQPINSLNVVSHYADRQATNYNAVAIPSERSSEGWERSGNYFRDG